MPIASSADLPVIDNEVFNEVREMLDGEFDELLEEFKSDTKVMLVQLSSAASSGDLEQLTMIAHTLGSCSGHLGFSVLSQVSRSLEEKARSNQGQNEDFFSMVDALNQHYQNVLTALSQ